MALVVTHNSTADGDPLIDGDDWNANHTLTGGGTFRVPKYIATATPDAASSVTFSSLNGDVDEEYLLVGDVFIDSSSDTQLILKPNDVTTNQLGVRIHSFNASSAPGSDSVDRLVLTQNGWSKDSYNMFDATLRAKTGKTRLLLSHSVEGMVSGYKGGNMVKAEWNDNSTNITSLVIAIGTGTFTGTIKLYKMVDLAI